MNEEIQKLIAITDQQKGELLFLQVLVQCMMSTMPKEFRSSVIVRFDKAVESTRRSHLYSEASDDVISSFDHYVATLQNRVS